MTASEAGRFLAGRRIVEDRVPPIGHGKVLAVRRERRVAAFRLPGGTAGEHADRDCPVPADRGDPQVIGDGDVLDPFWVRDGGVRLQIPSLRLPDDDRAVGVAEHGRGAVRRHSHRGHDADLRSQRLRRRDVRRCDCFPLPDRAVERDSHDVLPVVGESDSSNRVVVSAKGLPHSPGEGIEQCDRSLECGRGNRLPLGRVSERRDHVG